MARFRTYDPTKVSVVCGGEKIKGFAPGTFVVVERLSEAYRLIKGSEGTHTRSKTHDNTGRITITLLQTSEANQALAGFWDEDEEGRGTFDVEIQDATGGFGIVTGTFWIAQYPRLESGVTDSDREWVLETDNLSVRG